MAFAAFLVNGLVSLITTCILELAILRCSLIVNLRSFQLVTADKKNMTKGNCELPREPSFTRTHGNSSCPGNSYERTLIWKLILATVTFFFWMGSSFLCGGPLGCSFFPVGLTFFALFCWAACWMFVGIGDHAVPGLCGLVTAPSSFALRYGGPSLSRPSLTSPCVFQSFFVMSSSDHDFWLRELARTGLSASGRKELLTSLTKAVADREKYFPQAPSPYLCRVRQFLMAAFLPQKGPLFVATHPGSEQELLSRSQCW